MAAEASDGDYAELVARRVGAGGLLGSQMRAVPGNDVSR
jgi:hypothetical protein